MHIELGKFNRLTVVKEVDFGVYLDGGEDGEILLPARYVPEGCQIGDTLDVFLYLDIEERLVATTQTPLAQVGDFAYLEAVWTNQFGAFLGWGLMKDLFVPFREQTSKMRVGNHYVVHVHIDPESYRIVASAKVDRYLSKGKPGFAPGTQVDILVWHQTELGYKVIVNNEFGGLLYENEIFGKIEPGMKLKAYVKQVREDGKIDLTLQKAGMERIKDFAPELLKYIESNGGYTPLNDKSSSEVIYDTFGVSKKTFKKAVGDLYKRHRIELKEDGIYLAG